MTGEAALPEPQPRRPVPPTGGRVLPVIAVGGVLGAELRYGTGLLLPSGSAGFPWATVTVNVVGGLGIGVLMGLLGRPEHPHPLLRPFLGVGILGGFTTFSTYSTDLYRLLDLGRPLAALGYGALTLFAALAATVIGLALASIGTRPAAEPGPC